MTSLSKTMAKFGSPRNKINYMSFERFSFIKAILNVLFIEFESLSKVMDIYVKFWLVLP